MKECCEARPRRRWRGAASLGLVVAVVLALRLLTTGCSFPEPPGNCEGVEVRGTCYDGSTGPDCSTQADCAAVPGKLVCDVGGTDTCVQCTPTMVAACTGQTPVCEGLSCRACSAHSECPLSDTCLPDGSCADAASVVYVKDGGAAKPCGTKGMPCGKARDALEQVSVAKPYLRVTGTIMDGDLVIDNKAVTIIGEPVGGEPTAVLKGSPNKVILDVKNAVAIVKIYDLRIQDADNAGVKLDANSSVELHRKKVTGSNAEGVLIANGKAMIEQSEISGTKPMDKYGIGLQTGELSLHRSKIANNNGGGIFVARNQKFTIANTFIVGNKAAGGVAIVTPGVGSVFQFNTVADNANPGTGAADAGGIYCDGPAFTFSNNLIYRNTGGNGGYLQTVGNCQFTGSFKSPDNMAETTTMGFVKDTEPRDYHLTAASPTSVRDVSTAVCTGLVDYDGEARPQGGACDLGADEYRAP